MSVEHGGGSTEDQRSAESMRDSGRHVFVHLYESYAASLFDYCDGLLRDTIAAVDTVQDSLVAADAQAGSMPEPDKLRLSLYSVARQQCLSQLPGGRTKLSGHAETSTLDELGAAVPDFEVAGPAGETVLILRAALDRLSDRDREVLNLAFRHRFTDADLAAVLGVSSRRAHALLSEASTRFARSAPVVAALRAAVREGRPRCEVLAAIIGRRDLATLPLTPQFCRQVARHLESCADCALSLGDRAFSADQISEIPLAIPPGRLRLRISRTALAVGSYRRPAAGSTGRPDKQRRAGQGGGPVPLRPQRGVPKVMAVSSVTLAALVVPAAMLYRLAEASQAPRSSSVRAVLASQSPTPATTVMAPEVSPPTVAHRHKHHRLVPPLPGMLTPAQLGELPVSLTGQGQSPPSGSSPPGRGPTGAKPPLPGPPPTSPAPAPTKPAPTTPASTTPAPSTPPPTTPEPTPTPSS